MREHLSDLSFLRKQSWLLGLENTPLQSFWDFAWRVSGENPGLGETAFSQPVSCSASLTSMKGEWLCDLLDSMLHREDRLLGTVCNILLPFKAVVSHCIDVPEWINNLEFQCQRLICPGLGNICFGNPQAAWIIPIGLHVSGWPPKAPLPEGWERGGMRFSHRIYHWL